MRFAALFLDNLDPSALDKDLTRRHFDYLRAVGPRITSAGGLKNTPDGPFCGSLWVIEAENLDQARALVDADPYCDAGLRPDRRIFICNRPAALNA